MLTNPSDEPTPPTMLIAHPKDTSAANAVLSSPYKPSLQLSPDSSNIFARLYAWWVAIPLPIRKAMQGAVVSYQFSILNISLALYGGYVVYCNALKQPITFTGFESYVGSTWFVTLAGLVSSIYRARQGYNDAKATPFQPGTAPALQQQANEKKTSPD